MLERWRGLSTRSRAVVAAALLYSILHFAYSGVWYPFRQYSSMVQMDQEMLPLQQHLGSGRPVTLDNPRQYGPTFFFVMHPLLRWASDEPEKISLPEPDAAAWRLFSALYVVELVAAAGAFALIVASLVFCLRREPAAPPRHDLFWAIAAVAVLWLNFAPVLYMLVTRCVEGWELFLIAGAIYAALTGRHAWSGAAIAAAALIKTLPAFFMLILLLRDRRAFAAACVTGVALLACSHALYGPEMGALYPVRLAATASSKYTPAFTMFENMAVKSMVAKALGHLQPPGPDGAPKSGPYLDGLDGDPQTGAYLVISKERLSAANSVGAVWSLALVAWCIWAVVRPATSSRPYDLFWSWSFADVVMLVVSPMVAFEYTVLLLPAFSFACAAIVYRRGSANWWWIAGAFAVAVFLVGNIVPRQIVLRVIPVAWLTSLNPSNVHLSPTEAYLHYGFPMIGLVLLLLVVWALRPRLQPSHP